MRTLIFLVSFFISTASIHANTSIVKPKPVKPILKKVKVLTVFKMPAVKTIQIVTPKEFSNKK